MTHRDVRVSLYGLVAGVIVGAGLLTFARDGSFLGSTVAVVPPEVMLHGAPSRADYTQRNVSKKGVPLRSEGQTNSYPTLKEPTANSASSANVPAATSDTCAAARRVVTKITAVYNKYVPDTLKNTEIRQNMDAVLRDSAAAECPKDETTSSAGTVSSAKNAGPVDNDCEMYPRHSARYTQCVLAEQNGKTYP